MAGQKPSPEWLPPGWTTAVKVSKNNNKYKCYSDPSHKFKFHSKREVLRYLNSIEINSSPKSVEKNDEPVKSESQEKKDTVKRSDKKYVVEKTVAEGLPPGWIKEVKLTKKGHNIRKDSYYTDPISGYVFLSLKDSKRYVKTGKLGKNAYKPKDKGHTNVELGDDRSSSPSIAQGQKSPESGTNEQIYENQSSKLIEIVKDKEIVSFASTEDHICLPRHDSDQCSDSLAISDINPQPKSLEHREGKGESNLHTSVSAPVVGDCLEKLLENGVESRGSNSIQRRINKSNDKRAPELPRRASKRLAGIKLEPAPELKTNNRTRQLAARRSVEAETSSSETFRDLATPEEHPEKLESETMANEQQELSIILLQEPLQISEEQAGEEEHLPISDEQAANEEPLPTPKERAGVDEPLPISEEQAGEEEHLPTSEQAGVDEPIPISEEQAGEEGPSQISEEQAREEEPLQLFEEQATEEEPANKVDVEPASPLNLSLTDLWTDPCIEFAIKTLTGAIPVGDENKVDENPGSSLDLPFSDIWMDPCIEFAVKTLTGAIPLDEDLGIQNFFQQQISSSDTQEVGGVMLPNVDNFCQTDYISQHFDAVENSHDKEQAPVTSKLPHASNSSFQNSGGSGLHQNVKRQKLGECP